MFVPALAVGATGGRMAGRIVKVIVRCGNNDIVGDHAECEIKLGTLACMQTAP